MAVVRVLQILSGSIVTSTAAGAALAATSIFTPVLAPPGALGLLVAALALIAVVRTVEHEKPSRAAFVAAMIGLAVTAALAPPVALLMAATASVTVWLTLRHTTTARRAGLAAAAAIGVGVAPLVVAFALPDMPMFDAANTSRAMCMLPSPGDLSVQAWMHAAAGAFANVGPFAVSVAALGAFGARGMLKDRRAWPAIALATCPLVVPFRTNVDLSLAVMAPAIVGFWCLVAVGLNEIVAATRRGVLGGIAAAIFVTAVPILEAGALRDPVVPRDLPFGHEALSHASFARLVRVLPSGARLVEEDAITDVLLRSAAKTASVASKRIVMVERTSEAVSRAVRSGEVFAMPRAEAGLRTTGLRFADSGLPAGGLSRVAAGGACGAVTSTWTPVPGLSSSDRLALVADRADVYGPIVVYLASDRPFAPQLVDWPDPARRGYFVSVYDTSVARDRERLAEDVAIDKAPRTDPAIAAPIVTRFELWRVPGAPLQLVVGLNRPPLAALTRTVRGTAEWGLRVCPAFDHPVTRLEPPRLP